MKVWIAPYTLKLKSSPNSQQKSLKREGFLIKIQDYNMRAGYADCHPVREFGDASVAQQIKALRQGKFTELLERSLYCAILDGQARERGESLFTKTKVKSHFTWTDGPRVRPTRLEKIAKEGYRTIKLKLGRDPQAEALLLARWPKELQRMFTWRLDFNGKGGKLFLSKAPENFLEKVELVEDPEPYQDKLWKKLEKDFSVKIAWDQPPRGKDPESFKGLRVIKPARQFLVPREQDIITNSMDHPLGQSFAFWSAQQRQEKFSKAPLSGLKTQHLFVSNAFFSEISSKGPVFQPSKGTGLGFDELLEKQDWKPL